MPLFTSECLQRAGDASVQKVRTKFDNNAPELLKDVVELSCRYLGVVENGVVSFSDKAQRRNDVRYEWVVHVSGREERSEATVRCDNACKRGAPFPEHWATALRCTGLEQKARSAASGVRGVTDVT